MLIGLIAAIRVAYPRLELLVTELREANRKLSMERDKAYEVMDSFASHVAEKVGEAYFAALTRWIGETLKVKLVFIGSYSPGNESMATTSVYHDGKPEKNFTYALKQTPCEEVMKSDLCIHESNVTKLFPQDQILIDMGIESYAGIPLRYSDSSPLGILVIVDTKPITDRDEIARLVRFCAGRTSAELERQVSEQQRREAYNALLTSEERCRTLVEHAPEAITMIDVDTGLYVDANPMAEALHGRPRDELIGKMGPAILSPEFQLDGRPSSEAAPDYLNRALAGEFPKFEWMHLTPDGKETLCEVSLARLPHPHRKLVRASISDITERKSVEEQLRQAQKMDAIGQLTGGIAHDFNNLLTVIMGNLQTVEDDLRPDDKKSDYVRRAIMASRRAADLTHRMLAFARKQALRPIVVDIRKLITATVDLLHRTLGEHIDIELVGTASPWLCKVDANQLENAILNLAMNARDAMPVGGKLTIETANMRLDDEYAAAQADVIPGQYVMLSVTDTGRGISQEVKSQIFEPFFTTKDRGHGAGLGLSMVYGFVKQSGGHISVYREEGEGTTFKIYLPRIVGKEEPITPTARSAEYSAHGESILVVEDDADVRTMVIRVLRKYGYDV